MSRRAAFKPQSHWPVQDPARYKALSWFKPYEKNPRTHPAGEIDLLAALINKVGPDQPIVVDEHQVIIKGHGRLAAAMQAGLTHFTFEQHLGLSDADKSALRIADNAIPLLAGWNHDLILAEVTDLKKAGFDLPLLGFPEAQLRIFGVSLGTDSGADPESAPARPAAPVSRLGDCWVLGTHRLLCGDSTVPEDVALALNGAKPKVMVTDPPYGVDYNPAWRADANKWKGSKVKIGGKAMGTVTNDDKADWTEAWNLFPGDIAYVWHGGLRSVEQALSLEKAGFVIRSQIIWNKMRLVISRGDYHWQHEACWYAVRKGKTGQWNGSRTESTVWDIPKPQASETGHGTQKPVACMQRPILNNSKPGATIYEPFSGSGTTIVACEITARRCIAIELDPAYVDVAALRWQTVSGKEAVLAGTKKTFAEVQAERKTKKAPRRAPSKSSRQPDQPAR